MSEPCQDKIVVKHLSPYHGYVYSVFRDGKEMRSFYYKRNSFMPFSDFSIFYSENFVSGQSSRVKNKRGRIVKAKNRRSANSTAYKFARAYAEEKAGEDTTLIDLIEKEDNKRSGFFNRLS